MRRNLILLCLIAGAVCTAQKPVLEYLDIQKKYSDFPENDARALPYIKKSIFQGKKNNNYRHLVYAYEDAAYYSKNRAQKLLYSDSIIQAAKKTGNAGIISKAFLAKGIVYYFNYRKYDKALDQYIFAAAFADKTDDDYLIFKIKYNIGVVKSYLGYHEEAVKLFRECSRFFDSEMKNSSHPTFLYNNTRGYLNSIHQMIISYRQSMQDRKADSLITLTNLFPMEKEFLQENAYFLKEKGISAFRHKAFHRSIESLLASAEMLKEKEEDAYLTAVYYYLARNYHHLKKTSQTEVYLSKVDSLFRKNQTVLPETRAAYELLLKRTDYRQNAGQATYYIQQLLKADSILNRDLPYLSARIHREYDTKAIWAERDKLLEAKKWRDHFMVFAVLIISGMAGFLTLSKKREKQVLRHYNNLQRKLNDQTQNTISAPEKNAENRKSWYEPEIAEEILEKLKVFEKGEGFINPDLTVISLAAQLKVTKNNLSYVINEHMNMNFNSYLNALRIGYITAKLNNDREYLKLKTPELAKKCGIKTRQHFSRLFYEHNKIRPSDFIELRKKQLKIT